MSTIDLSAAVPQLTPTNFPDQYSRVQTNRNECGADVAKAVIGLGTTSQQVRNDLYKIAEEQKRKDQQKGAWIWRDSSFFHFKLGRPPRGGLLMTSNLEGM